MNKIKPFISESDIYMDSNIDSLASYMKKLWKSQGYIETWGLQPDKSNSKWDMKGYEHNTQTQEYIQKGSEDFYILTSPIFWNKNKELFPNADGWIYLVRTEDRDIWNYIAYQRLAEGVKEMNIQVLKVDNRCIMDCGIYSEVDYDQASPFIWMVNCPFIMGKDLTPVERFKTNRDKFYQTRMDLYQISNPTLYNLYIQQYLSTQP